MNILFGRLVKTGIGTDPDSIRRVLSADYEGEFRMWPMAPARVSAGWIRSSDLVMARSEREGVELYLYGWLHGPLHGDWPGGRPMDSCQAAADYLLARYSALGLGFLDGLFGHYCVMVNDLANRVVQLARDPRGSCQLFYYADANGLSFCTSIYALGRLLGDNWQPDRSLEDFFLVNGFYPWRRTMYRGVLELLPKKILTWQNRQVSIHEYQAEDPWSGRYERFHETGVTADTPGLTSALHEAFMTALEEQTASEARAAVFLGGFDSALLAAGLKDLGKEVETFSYLYDQPIYNQPHTDLVSNYLGCRHHWIPVNEQVLAEGLRNYQHNFELPSNYANFPIQTLHLAKAIRNRGIGYCYSGATADELFMGSGLTRKRAIILNSVGNLPSPLVDILIRMFEWRGLDMVLGRPYHVFLNMLRTLERDRPTRCFPGFNIFDSFSLSLLRKQVNPMPERTSKDILDEICQTMVDLSPIRLAASGLGFGAGGGGMIGKRGCVQGQGLVCNTPYGHPGLQAFIRGLPENLITPQPKGKRRVSGKNLLRHMATTFEMLPEQVIYQAKRTAVDAPLEEWYADLLKPNLLEILDRLPFEYDQAYVENMVRYKPAEKLYTNWLATRPDQFIVISHNIALLTTYAAFMPGNDRGKS